MFNNLKFTDHENNYLITSKTQTNLNGWLISKKHN